MVNLDESSYAARFDAREFVDPEKRCRAWLAERANPTHALHGRLAGAHPKRVEIWPDYQALSAAGARFMNWGLLQLNASGHRSLLTRMLGGQAAPQALASILFPAPT